MQDMAVYKNIYPTLALRNTYDGACFPPLQTGCKPFRNASCTINPNEGILEGIGVFHRKVSNLTAEKITDFTIFSAASLIWIKYSVTMIV